MWLPKEVIDLPVDDTAESIAFYEALLAAVPTHRSARSTVFDLESPPLVLTLEERPGGRRPGSARQRATGARGQWALLVPEPKQVGDAALRLRRAGVQIWVQDEGVEARDPDGNGWRVRCDPAASARLILPPASAARHELRRVVARPAAYPVPGGARARGGRPP